ncbi:MAG: HAD-IIB family hydrolase [Candidatus Kaiserbacteria bacterium]|nr:HAD-IIB family hydrolase [Candidatus Kaiserbacteria bacterium]
MYKLVIFDLDGTLAESKQPLTPMMAALLARLLSTLRVAIASGGALAQFQKQVVDLLPLEAHLENLYLLPTSGGALYEWHNDAWNKVYEERLSETEAKRIEEIIKEAAVETRVVHFDEPAFGERIEYRGAQVTFSALGQKAPLEAKKAWDPDHSKRRALQAAIVARLPGFSATIGGATSIDVTKHNIDKAYGVRKLCERIGISEIDAVYVGDELVAGGNDEVIYKTQVPTHAVTSPEDTARYIVSLLS